MSQKIPYPGYGCPYCGAAQVWQDIINIEYDKTQTLRVESMHCPHCKRDYYLRFKLTHWMDDSHVVTPLSIVTQPTPMEEAIVVYHPVLDDILHRVKTGRQHYGCVLSTHNGRNALQDLYEELLDAVMYCKQRLLEDEWVPVERGLPVSGTHVLAYDAYTQTVGEAVVLRNSSFEFVGNIKDDCNVTHWRPLPRKVPDDALK